MEKVKEFLTLTNGYGYGYGYGDGYGYGYGDGDGYGSGSGSGYGDGDGYGSGSGSGSGYGYDDGYGSGSGDGDGYGYGDGYGSGSGDGDGYGSGYGSITSHNGLNVNIIDSIPTVILSVRNNVAKGLILNLDLSTKPCYIVKNGRYFAHGDSVKLAYQDLQEKVFARMSVDEIISEFNTLFTSNTEKYNAKDLFDWHGRLTGSCKSGRDSFVHNRGINLSTAKFTIVEFITITYNEYGGDVIKTLKESREIA